ncbi:MBL fold metallo-hydrolase [Streptomyces sp. BE303]|uniref:MBL fold metallo-hydrolase n=1 Tax=Streptomyces sp. BE303 TaxID=3002528 RepID=UPI002E76DF96|nr:MBL fold metallo-hydrolase [Streptomyces sp. BE303]MED7954938.1 MBL fold metallo-hydrolase [Streptomyces sp. BE303]
MQHSGLARRAFLGSAAVAGAGLVTAATTGPAAAATTTATNTPATTVADDRPVPESAASPSATATDTVYRWLGTAGWRIDHGRRTVLFDPYLTRFHTGLYDGTFSEATALTVNTRLVDEHAGRPELVLVSHSHWDHINDVPHIALTTGATVVGTETTYHLLRAWGVPAGQLVVVRGGEVLDFGDGLVVEAVSARHSRNGRRQYFAPGTLHSAPAQPPATVGDLPEGDTLAFQLSFAGGPSAFLTGASDFAERELAGLRPDIAMVAVPSSASTHRYVPRLLEALGRPRTVVPVHWDRFETELVNPVRPDADLGAFVAQVRQTSPRSRVVVPDYLTPRTFR